MSGKQFDDMLKTWRASEQNLLVESIRTQIKLIDAIRHRHMLWMNNSKDTEAVRLHMEIIDSLRQVQQKYAKLLEIHEKLIE